MRWDQLFGDLAAQAEELERQERGAEIADRSRIETGRVTLGDRLSAVVGRPVQLWCAGGFRAGGVLVGVGSDWALVATAGAPAETLIALPAVLGVGGLGRQVGSPDGVVAKRLGLRSALRRIASDRAGVSVRLSDATVSSGTLDAVGADWVDLALHPTGEARRAGQVRGVLTIPLHALVSVQRVAG